MLKKDQDSHQEKKKGIFHQVVERFSSFRRSTTDGDTADIPTQPCLADGMTFAEFNLSDAVNKGIADAGFVR
ncbi:MAG: hypothetical protein JRD00_12435, partial [Deltaproteobacteria bacterium]|nr:hypothetical protein [Deltaproteobacteria bacterium]